jgi:hypothetical protein
MTSHYYELTGWSKQIVDGLEYLYYVRERWDTGRVESIAGIAKQFFSFALLIPVVPLTILAHLVRIVARQRIPAKVFDEEFAQWKEISYQGLRHNDLIIEKLIASKINPKEYTKFMVLDFNAGRPGGGYFSITDGHFSQQGDGLAQALQDKKKVLICMNMDRAFSSAFHQTFPQYQALKRHVADNLLSTPYALDSESKDQFPEWIKQGLDVLFFDHLCPTDFSYQVSLAVSHRVQKVS